LDTTVTDDRAVASAANIGLRVLAAETDRQVSALVQEALEAFLERREREAAEGKKRKA
jgi:predicted transcriptional regulator